MTRDGRPVPEPVGNTNPKGVDHVDGCTMVFTTEYLPANGTFNWAMYIYSFKLSTCQ